jgi:hypothetical protein
MAGERSAGFEILTSTVVMIKFQLLRDVTPCDWYIVTKFRTIVLPSSSRLLFESKDEVSPETLVKIHQATGRNVLTRTLGRQ